MNPSNLNDISNTISALIVSIKDHQNRLAKMHPESHSHHITKKKIVALTAAKDGLQSYITSMEEFWKLDSETIPAHRRDSTLKALRTMRDGQLEKFSQDPDVDSEGQNLAKLVLSERFLERNKNEEDVPD